ASGSSFSRASRCASSVSSRTSGISSSSIPSRIRSLSKTCSSSRDGDLSAAFSTAGDNSSRATWSRTSSTPIAWLTENFRLLAHAIASSCGITLSRQYTSPLSGASTTPRQNWSIRIVRIRGSLALLSFSRCSPACVCSANLAIAASTPLRTFGSNLAYCGMNESAIASSATPHHPFSSPDPAVRPEHPRSPHRPQMIEPPTTPDHLRDNHGKHSGNQAGQEVLRLLVDGVDERADHAAREKHLVGVADQLRGLRVRHRLRPEGGVAAGLAPHHRPAVAEDEVGAEDDPDPVVLEPLRGIDAAHLPETAGVRGPQLARRRVADRPVALDVPRPCPVTDDDVGDEGPFASSGVLARVAPRPAEPGGHPGGASAFVLVAQQILHL